VRREQQQQGQRVGGDGGDGAAVTGSAAQLTAEELRLRRLQRFS
jgi:hypothetical protein